MPIMDENGCLVLEEMEPNTRNTRSLLICAMYPEDGPDLRLAVASAHYSISVKSNPLF
jgi:hypothetical protein